MADLKVSAGDPVKAKDWNTIVDLVSASSSGNPGAIAGMSRVMAKARNDSGRDYDVGELFVVTGYDGPDDESVYDIPGSIEYVVDEPTWHTDISPVVVAAEPIPDGERGLVVVSGQCLIRVTNTIAGESVMIDPGTTYHGKVSSSGVASVIARPGDTYVLAMLRDRQSLWRYKLTQASQAPAVTTAKLYTLGGTEFSTTAINLSDPLSIGDGDAIDYEGYCQHVGDEFHIAPGPCP